MLRILHKTAGQAGSGTDRHIRDEPERGCV